MEATIVRLSSILNSRDRASSSESVKFIMAVSVEILDILARAQN